MHAIIVCMENKARKASFHLNVDVRFIYLIKLIINNYDLRIVERTIASNKCEREKAKKERASQLSSFCATLVLHGLQHKKFFNTTVKKNLLVIFAELMFTNKTLMAKYEFYRN